MQRNSPLRWLIWLSLVLILLKLPTIAYGAQIQETLSKSYPQAVSQETTFTIYRKLAERNYRPFVWPSRYPRKGKLSQYEGLLAPQIVEDIEEGVEEWGVTDPDRFNDFGRHRGAWKLHDGANA